jgi:hypothetical protein
MLLTVHTHMRLLILDLSSIHPQMAVTAEDRGDFKAEAGPYLSGAAERRHAMEEKEYEVRGATRVLLCGWRSDWDDEMTQFKDRIRDISCGMAVRDQNR